MTSAPWRCTRGRANRSPLIGGVARPTRPRVRARALGRVSLKWSCRRGCPAAWSPPPGPTCSTFFSGQGRRSSLRGAEGSTARSGGRPTYSLQETTCTSAAPLGRVGWRAASVATYPQGRKSGTGTSTSSSLPRHGLAGSRPGRCRRRTRMEPSAGGRLQSSMRLAPSPSPARSTVGSPSAASAPATVGGVAGAQRARPMPIGRTSFVSNGGRRSRG